MTINEARYSNPADVSNALSAMPGDHVTGFIPFALCNALDCISRLQTVQQANFETAKALKAVVEAQSETISRLQEMLAGPDPDKPDAFGNTEADIIYGDF